MRKLKIFIGYSSAVRLSDRLARTKSFTVLTHLFREAYSWGLIQLLQKETKTGELCWTNSELQRSLCFVIMSSVKRAFKKKRPLQTNNLHATGCLNMYICTSHYFWSLPWCSSQDLISITLMNGRALLLCVVGVSGLLGKEGGTKLCKVVHSELLDYYSREYNPGMMWRCVRVGAHL